jgi:hypothetical protein
MDSSGDLNQVNAEEVDQANMRSQWGERRGGA